MSDETPDEPLLSTEETSALLDAMQEGAVEGPEAQDTELGSPEGPLRDAMGRADALLPTLAEAARHQLLRQTSLGVKAELLPSEIVPRDLFAGSLAPGALVYGLRVRGHFYGLLVLDPALARWILDRCMGAPPEDGAAAPAEAAFSPLDRRILRPFPRAVADVLGRAFLEEAEVELEEDGASADGDDGAGFEPMLRLGLRFTVGTTAAGEAAIALTAAAVGGSHAPQDDRRGAVQDARTQVAVRLAGAEVELVALLGETPSTVRALLGLKAGDVIRLDRTPEDPVVLRVEDVTVGQGLPIVHHGNLAIEVTEGPRAERAR